MTDLGTENGLIKQDETRKDEEDGLKEGVAHDNPSFPKSSELDHKTQAELNPETEDKTNGNLQKGQESETGSEAEQKEEGLMDEAKRSKIEGQIIETESKLKELRLIEEGNKKLQEKLNELKKQERELTESLNESDVQSDINKAEASIRELNLRLDEKNEKEKTLLSLQRRRDELLTSSDHSVVESEIEKANKEIVAFEEKEKAKKVLQEILESKKKTITSDFFLQNLNVEIKGLEEQIRLLEEKQSLEKAELEESLKNLKSKEESMKLDMEKEISEARHRIEQFERDSSKGREHLNSQLDSLRKQEEELKKNGSTEEIELEIKAMNLKMNELKTLRLKKTEMEEELRSLIEIEQISPKCDDPSELNVRLDQTEGKVERSAKKEEGEVYKTFNESSNSKETVVKEEDVTQGWSTEKKFRGEMDAVNKEIGELIRKSLIHAMDVSVWMLKMTLVLERRFEMGGAVRSLVER